MSERIRTCYEVTSRISERLGSEFPETEFYVLGGIATGAVANYQSVDAVAREIYPVAASDLSVVRDNGTLRDADILVRSPDKQLTTDMAKAAEEAAQGDMKIDVFRLEPRRIQGGCINDAFRYWTSRRELTPDGRVLHVLPPADAIIPATALNPWIIRPDGMHGIPMVEPYYHLLSYDLRSIGGPRPKDQEKLQPVRTAAHLMTKRSGTDMTGYRELEQMSEILRIFRQQGVRSAAISDELILYTKSKLSAFMEKQKWVVDLVQRPEVQKVVRRFVGSQKTT